MTDARKKDIAGFLPGLAQKCSYTERRAVNLERQVLRLKMCEYMLDKVGGKFTGVITDIKSFGIIVELPDTTDGVIRRYSMPDEFDFEDGDTSIKGYFTGMELKTGQSVQVILSDVNVDKRTITFEIAPASKRSKVTE
jgi:ribonuclease R